MHLFQPFRALGYVSSHLPIDIQARGNKYFLTLGIGTTFQIYGGEKLNLLFVGEEAGLINALCSHKDFTFVATNDELLVYRRQKIQKRIRITLLVQQLMVVGNLLVLIGEEEFSMLSLEDLIKDDKVTSELETECHVSKISFGAEITALVHPSTYLNKVLVALGQRWELWNIDSYSRVHSFKEFSSDITVMVQSPALDVVAIGLLDGSIVLYNIKQDKEIMKFRQESKVTCISFRSDGEAIMATAGNNGDVFLWDLNEKRLVFTMTNAHKGSIHTCFFYHGMPLLLTSANDNSVKQWLFDSLDKSPRLLKSRSGHEKAPSSIEFCTPTSLLTTGLDSTVRFTSIIRDSQNTELSQGSLEHKSKKYNLEIEQLRLPQVVQFAYNESKQREWDNVITCHTGDSKARTWSLRRKAIGSHTLETTDGSIVKVMNFNFSRFKFLHVETLDFLGLNRA